MELQAGRRAPWARAGDALALGLLTVLLAGLAGSDGGYVRHLQPRLGVVLAVAALALPALAVTAGRLPPWLRVALALWGVGVVGALVLAQERSDWLLATIAYTVGPLAGLATWRVWQRRWGPAALAALVVAAFVLYTHRSLLQWVGYVDLGAQPRWLALSWWNQSAALMAAFGVLLAGLAVTTRRLVRVGAGACAATSLAGVFHSGSRGGIVIAALGLAGVALAGLRTGPGRRVGAALAGCLAGAALLSALLLAPVAAVEGAGAPLTARDQAAGKNLYLRLHHARAALAMFADRPLAGYGPGAYRAMSRPFTSPGANLTARAHNEFAEALAAGGLLLGVPLAIAGLLAAGAVLRRLRAGRPPEDDSPVPALSGLRAGLSLGALGAALALTVHAAAEFDWDYLVLAGLLFACWAMAGPPRRATEHAPAWHAAALAPLAVALLMAGYGLAVHRSDAALWPAAELEPSGVVIPWRWQGAPLHAVELARAGQAAAAAATVEHHLRWNPGVTDLHTAAAIARWHAGDGTLDEALDTLDGQSSFALRNTLLADLVDGGRHAEARSEMERLLDRYAEVRAWSVERAVVDTLRRRVELEAATAGCAAAHALARDLLDHPLLTAPAHPDGRRAVEQAPVLLGDAAAGACATR